MHIENRGELFRAAIAFYPYCDASLINLNTPILILTGELDDWCPAEMCKLKMPKGKSKHETILKIYPEATHCFDFEGIDDTKLGHRLLYNPTATDDAIKQVKGFLLKYLIAP
jgi:dienelactone hydrolase